MAADGTSSLVVLADELVIFSFSSSRLSVLEGADSESLNRDASVWLAEPGRDFMSTGGLADLIATSIGAFLHPSPLSGP